MASPRKVLVGYCTRSGFTRSVAQRIATKLREPGHDVDIADLELCSRHPERYEMVVLGSGVLHGEHHEIVEAFIAEHRARLAALPCGLFSVDRDAYHSTEPDPGGHMAHLFAKVGWTPQHALAVAGKVAYREHTWPRRMMMRLRNRRLGAPTDTSRDHVLTDWARVDAFSAALAGDLVARAA